MRVTRIEAGVLGTSTLPSDKDGGVVILVSQKDVKQASQHYSLTDQMCDQDITLFHNRPGFSSGGISPTTVHLASLESRK